MRRITNQIPTFLLFAMPSFWTLAVFYIVFVLMKKGFISDLIPVTLVSIAIIVAAILLVKRYGWICLPMIALGIYIALQQDQHFGLIFRFFGIYMVLHYAACGVHLYINRKKEGETGRTVDYAMVAIAYMPILFAFSILIWC